MHRAASEGHRVLVCAPYGNDAPSVVQLLSQQGYQAEISPEVTDVARHLGPRTGVVVMTEEALGNDLSPLKEALERQPAWSDVPFILLVGRRAAGAGQEAVRRRLPEKAINVVLLERPLSAESLTSAVASAMRARQKQIEIRDQLAELEAERTRLATLLDALPVGVAFVNPDGSTLISNPEFRRFLPTGEIPSRMKDGEVRWVGYESDGSRIGRDRFVTHRALGGERVDGIEFRYHPPVGPPLWTRVSGIPLVQDDRIVGSISVIVDIEEQKRAQSELADIAVDLERRVAERTQALADALSDLEREAAERERAEAALRQSQKMEAVGQLTGGIAHDFNNMLTGVIGAIELMKRRIAAGRLEELDRYMDAATTSAERAAALTARLLAFSRRQSLDSRATNVNDLLLSLKDLFLRTINEQIKLSIRCAPDLPCAMVDANQLENALLNLAINARDAMPHGGELVFETWLAPGPADAGGQMGNESGPYVVLAVSDTGIGMDEETLQKAFDPFFTTKPIGQGTGLGLSMIYGFMKQSRGQIRIESKPGTGSVVKLYLPLADVAVAVELAEQTAVHHGGGEKVLLVEDDDSVRILVHDVLVELGYEPIEAADAQGAIELLDQGLQFDLMVTDVGLPGLNGRQLAEIARQHLPDLPILFMTGYAENARQRSGFLAENMRMITKPFQIDNLSLQIKEMIDGGTGEG